jgi:hypothetical protein
MAGGLCGLPPKNGGGPPVLNNNAGEGGGAYGGAPGKANQEGKYSRLQHNLKYSRLYNSRVQKIYLKTISSEQSDLHFEIKLVMQFHKFPDSDSTS